MRSDAELAVIVDQRKRAIFDTTKIDRVGFFSAEKYAVITYDAYLSGAFSPTDFALIGLANDFNTRLSAAIKNGSLYSGFSVEEIQAYVAWTNRNWSPDGFVVYGESQKLINTLVQAAAVVAISYGTVVTAGALVAAPATGQLAGQAGLLTGEITSTADVATLMTPTLTSAEVVAPVGASLASQIGNAVTSIPVLGPILTNAANTALASLPKDLLNGVSTSGASATTQAPSTSGMSDKWKYAAIIFLPVIVGYVLIFKVFKRSK